MVMEELRLPKNIKVHFAGTEQLTYALTVQKGEVKHGLWTCYHFIAHKIGIACFSQVPKLREEVFVPGIITKLFRHNIMDSGLFTLMFGAKSGKKDARFIDRWFNLLCEFVQENNIDTTCVEVDCQKVLGVEEAWKYRKLMRDKLPNNRQINVFHLEDGKKGLDALIDFSDYIAFALTELRVCRRKDYKEFLYRMVCYVKNKKPDIDIHLLGCTTPSILRQCSFCTSCDSLTYRNPIKYGEYSFVKKKTRDLNPSLVLDIDKSITIFKERYSKYFKNEFSDSLSRYQLNVMAAMKIHKYYYAQLVGDQE